ncbi:MAG: MarR family transcriptional regulator, partial [Nocardioides sp.]|nr:MarR family transcriptional regulator [Nocardioides sp.]
MSIQGRDVTGTEFALTLERLVRLLRELASSADLSPTVVAVLGRLDGSGPLRLTELARLTGVTQPAMTQLVGRMERDG